MVGDHKGHHISDQTVENLQKIDPFVKKKNTLMKKIDASVNETEMFEEHVLEIEEQLQ